jgi:hypothetical protein
LWVSEWLLFNANCSGISWREQVNFQWDDDEVCFVVDQQLSWMFIVHWNNSPRIDMSPHSDTLIDGSPHSDILSWLRAWWRSNNKYHTIVFGLTRSGLEPMIYRTRGEHPNHYTTDAVLNIKILMCYIFLLSKGKDYLCLCVWFMVLNATFNNISVISWRSVLLVE